MTNASGPQVIRAVPCSRSECVFPASVVARAEGHQFNRAALCSAHYVSDAAGYRESYAVLGLKLSWRYVDVSPVGRLRTIIEIVDARRALDRRQPTGAAHRGVGRTTIAVGPSAVQS